MRRLVFGTGRRRDRIDNEVIRRRCEPGRQERAGNDQYWQRGFLQRFHGGNLWPGMAIS
jgi:hypothetical protein